MEELELRKILNSLLQDIPAELRPKHREIEAAIAAIIRLMRSPMATIRCDFD